MKFVILLLVGVIVRQSYGGPPIAKRIAEPRPIVGGQNAAPGQFKHQISLQYNEGHYCGGALISPTHVVTAAHCIKPNKAEWGGYTVVTGTNEWKRGGQRHRIKCIQPHPGFNHWSSVTLNDIAVITLEKPVIFNNLQAPISLSSRDYSVESGTPVRVSGWGSTFFGSPGTEYLNWVQLRVVPVNECSQWHPVTHNQVCTYHSVGKGTCHGDSGGPLISNNELIGVVSYGQPCAVGEPDVFTNVYAYLDYIKQCQEKCP